MFNLGLLGSIELVDDDGARVHALLRRPKRFALLAYLAAARPDTTYRRDRLVAMFWPEMPQARARAALRQSVLVLRQNIGADAIIASGDEELVLSLGGLRCDAVDFAQAFAEQRWEQALELYRGDLLTGFFIHDAREFDEWLEAERTRLRAMATRAAVAVAERALGSGVIDESIRAGRRAIELSPHDESATRVLIAALDRSGNRSGALAAYDALTRHLTADFDAHPSAETQAAVLAVRERQRVSVPAAAANVETERSDEAHDDNVAIVLAPRAPSTLVRHTVRAAAVMMLLLVTGSRHQTQGSLPARLPSAEARAAYERARHYVEKPTADNLRRAVALFGDALDAEPLFAAAHAGLGDAYLRLGYGSYLPPSESFPKAIAAARRAVELDSLAPEPHTTLGFARMYYEWDWAKAEQELTTATRLAPNYALGHEWYAYLLTVLHRDAEARRESDLALRLAPISPVAAVDAGFVAFYAGDYRHARDVLDGALLLAPQVPAAHLWLGRIAQQEGQADRAIAEFGATGALREWAPTIAAIGYVQARSGQRAAAESSLVHLRELATHQYVTAYAMALVYAGLGDRDEAFRWLNQSVAERTHWLVWLARDTRWAPIRDDPRFAILTARVGLPH